MPTRKLTVEFIGDEKDLQRAFKKTRSEADKTGRSLSDLSRKSTVLGRISSKSGASLVAVGKGAVVAGAGLGVAAVGAKKLFDAYTDSLAVSRQTETVLKSTGGAAKVTAKQIGDLATAISRKSGFDDEAVQSGENLLLTFTNIRNEAGKGNKIFNQTTRAATDMAASFKSAGKEMSIQDAVLQLGKALNDPEKGMTRLTRVGVSFTQAQKDQVAELVKSGRTMAAQKVILRELNKEFGGSAKTWGDTHPFDKLNVAFGNLQETLGGLLAPAFTAATDTLTKFLNQVQDGTGFGGQVRDAAVAAANGIKTAFDAVKPYVVAFANELAALWPPLKEGAQAIAKLAAPALEKVVDVFKSMPQAAQIATAGVAGFGALFLATGPVGAGIAALIGGAILIRRNWDSIVGVVNRVRDAITGWVNKNRADINSIISILRAFGEVIKTVVVKQFEFMLGVAKKVWPAIKQTIEGTLKVIQGIVNTIMGLIHGDFGRAWDGIKQIFSGSVKVLLGYIRGMSAPAREAAAQVGRAVLDALNAAWKGIKSLASRTFQAMIDAIRAKIRGASKAAADIATTVWNAVKSLPGEFVEIGKHIVQGLIDGIKSQGKSLLDAATSIAKVATDPIKLYNEISSPSKLTFRYGKWIGVGLANGLKASAGAVGDAAYKGLLFPLEGIQRKLQAKADQLQNLLSSIGSTSSSGSSSRSSGVLRRATNGTLAVIAGGNMLQGMGAQVAESKYFGGVTTTRHAHYANDHYSGNSIDINYAGGGSAELTKLKQAQAALQKRFGDLVSTLIEDAGSSNQHLHATFQNVKVKAKNAVSKATSGMKANKFNKVYAAHPTGTSGAALSPSEVMALAMQAGFSKEQARQVVRIAKGESSFMPGIYNSADNGMGLLQMTPVAGGWGPAALKKLQSLGGIDQMRNPLKNLKMAKWLFDQSGWSPWEKTRYGNSSLYGNLEPANIGQVMGGDGGSVTDGYNKQVQGLVKVNAQQQKAVEKAIAFRDAIKNTADQVTGNLTQAVQKFQEKWERTKGAAFDAQTAAMIADTPAARELAALQAQADDLARQREDAANQQALADAQASGDPNAIAEAQYQIDETARQRRIAELTAQVQQETQQIEEARAKERQKALEQDTQEFEENERKKSQKLIKQLAQRTISYAQFVKRINRMLAAIGGGTFSGSAQDEAAVVGGFSLKMLKALGLTPAQMQRILQQAGALDGDQILDSYASGTPYVPRTGIYQLHQGEAVVPANRNTAGGPLVHIENQYVQPTWSEDMFARNLLRQIERESRLTTI